MGRIWYRRVKLERIIVPHVVERKAKTGYYVDGKGNLWERPMRGGRARIVVAAAVERRPGYLYYVDGKGNLCEVAMKAREDPDPRDIW